MELVTTVPSEIKQTGLNYWMACVVKHWGYAQRDFSPDHIHDLRVALRRCRSIADVFAALDPHPAWKQMKQDGKKLFKKLGTLRDTQVLTEWVRRLAPENDETFIRMNRYLSEKENRYKNHAEKALKSFNKKKWTAWSRFLSARIERIPPESAVFRHIALERWSELRALHRQALRNRSHISYHRLRIGLKKFRYITENFLPTLYTSWGQDLKQLQDLLGEMHDLHVLWRTALEIQAMSGKESRTEWRRRIDREIRQRLDEYRQKMLGKTSLALAWRSELPDATEIASTAIERLRAWALFRDPDFAHAELVAKLALQIFDGLDAPVSAPAAELPDARRLLQAAALLHRVGMSKTRKKYHLASYRLIRKLEPPLGWNAETLRLVALIVRFHRGPIPRSGQKAFAGIPDKQKEALVLLCGVLRLAHAFDLQHQKQIQRLELKKAGGCLRITAPGYSSSDASAEKLAAARHLLEVACGLPILIG